MAETTLDNNGVSGVTGRGGGGARHIASSPTLQLLIERKVTSKIVPSSTVARSPAPGSVLCSNCSKIPLLPPPLRRWRKGVCVLMSDSCNGLRNALSEANQNDPLPPPLLSRFDPPPNPPPLLNRILTPFPPPIPPPPPPQKKGSVERNIDDGSDRGSPLGGGGCGQVGSRPAPLNSGRPERRDHPRHPPP